MRYFIGIDPGKKGAIAIIDKSGTLVHYGKFHTHTVWGNEVIDLSRLSSDIFSYCLDDPEITVLVEQVNSYNQGRKSAFSFAANSLGVVNYLLAIGLDVRSVVPSHWKRVLRLSDDKRKSIALAKQYFPGISVSHDEAEAILLSFLCFKSGTLHEKRNNN